jgi:hypothetical protein
MPGWPLLQQGLQARQHLLLLLCQGIRAEGQG